jgi:hypothetical protein
MPRKIRGRPFRSIKIAFSVMLINPSILVVFRAIMRESLTCAASRIYHSDSTLDLRQADSILLALRLLSFPCSTRELIA